MSSSCATRSYSGGGGSGRAFQSTNGVGWRSRCKGPEGPWGGVWSSRWSTSNASLANEGTGISVTGEGEENSSPKSMSDTSL
jgi:hypothetical protein